MKNLTTKLAALVAIISLGAISCSKSEEPTPIAAPTISIQDPEFDAETMTLRAMVVPSTDATAWYWKIESKGETLDFKKREGAAADEITRTVEYGVEYLISAYAENVGGMSQVAERRFCPLPDEASIAIGEATLDTKTMTVSCTIYPSKLTTTWYWRTTDIESDSETQFLEVVGNSEQTITIDYIYGHHVELYAYAMNAAGKSDVVVEQIYFEPEMATIEVSEPTFDESSMTVSFDVTPSQSTIEWQWSVLKDKQEVVIGNYDNNEPRTVSYEVVFDTDYTFTFAPANAVGKGEEAKTTFFVTGPMTEIHLSNHTAYSIDAFIEKNAHCVRYVAGAIIASAYDRNTFIEQAQSSLDPDEAYPFAAFNSATESRTFTEQDLVRNALVGNEHASCGIAFKPNTSYIIAVYGEDKDGHYDVITEEFTLPEATIDGNVGIAIEMQEVTETSAKVTVTADEECKVIVGHLPYASTDAEASYDFGEMSNDEAAEFVTRHAMAVPTTYTAPMTIELGDRLEIGTRYMAYAIAIKDGKIGEVALQEFTTVRPSLSGEAKIIAANIEEQTSHETLTITVTVDDKATSLRLYAAPSADHEAYAGNMEYIMDSNEYQNYREEYEVVNCIATATIDIYHPGDNYYIYASAVDSNGHAGEMACVAMLAGLDTEYYTTLAVPIDDGSIFNGTATVKMQVSDISLVDDRESVTIRLTNASSNLKSVWLYRVNNTTSMVRQTLENDLGEYPDAMYGSYKEAAIDTDYRYEDSGTGLNIRYDSLLVYDKTYGGDIIIAVTLDSSDRLRICECYVAGVGVQTL